MTTDLPQAGDLATIIVRAIAELGGQPHRHDIVETALKIGRFSAAQRAEPTRSIPKRRTYPTELHYRLSWAITHAHRNGEIERVERNIWRLRR